MSELHAAMTKAFKAIEGAQKDANNPHFKTKYADLSSVVAAIKPHLTENQLWFRQATHESADGVCVETIVAHSSGTELSFGKLFVPASKKDAQGFGSALTYARRYSLMTAFGVCPEDDDGNAACQKQPARELEQSDPSPAVINDAQWAEIVALIEANGADTAKICGHYKIDSIKTMTVAMFEHCRAALNKPKKESA